jgi:hypothetical protein
VGTDNVPQQTGKIVVRTESRRSTREYTHLFIAQVEELLKLNTTVRERTECALLLEVGGDLGVSNFGRLVIALLVSLSRHIHAGGIP